MGGGTPSRLSAGQLRRVVDALRERFDLSRLQEFTVEVNPEDVTSNWLAELKDLGVTRLSMGIQSFQPDLLEFMHRAHTVEQAHSALEMVSEAGFESFSVDLIYGNPGQTVDQLRDDLTRLTAWQPPHVSAYSLTIEPNTRLGKQYELGRLKPAKDDDIAGQVRIIRETLQSSGLQQYEVSNYAVPGHEAVHNSAYWQHHNYLGLGPAAHSFYWDPSEIKATRWHHPRDIHAYLSAYRSSSGKVQHPFQSSGSPSRSSQNSLPDNPLESNRAYKSPQPDREFLSLQTLAGERIMMGLRTTAGVSTAELRARYGYTLSDEQEQQISHFREKGWMAPKEPLRLTEEGFQLADAITLRLI